MNDHYADPLREAAAHGMQKVVQVTPTAAAAVQVWLHVKAQRVREQAERERQAADALRTSNAPPIGRHDCSGCPPTTRHGCAPPTCCR